MFVFGSEYTWRKEALLCLREGVACDSFLGVLVLLPKRVLHEEGSKGETSGLCSWRPRKRKLLSPWGSPLPHFLSKFSAGHGFNRGGETAVLLLPLPLCTAAQPSILQDTV